MRNFRHCVVHRCASRVGTLRGLIGTPAQLDKLGSLLLEGLVFFSKVELLQCSSLGEVKLSARGP